MPNSDKTDSDHPPETDDSHHADEAAGQDRETIDPLFTPPPKSRVFRIVQRILLALIVLAILVLAGVSALSLVGGNDPSLKEGLEKFFRDYTGMKTTITTLNDLQIYPLLRMDIEGVSSGTGEERISAKHIIVGMTFWDAVLSRGWLAASGANDLSLPAGFLLPRALKIETLSLGGEGTEAALKAKGHYNNVPFDLTLSMKTRASSHGTLYRIADHAAFTLVLNDLVFSGVAAHQKGANGLVFPEVSISDIKNRTPLVTGSADFSRDKQGQQRFALHLKATSSLPDVSEVNLKAFVSKEHALSGALVFPVLKSSDFEADGIFKRILALVMSLSAPPPSVVKESARADTPQDIAPLSGSLIFAAGLASDGKMPLLPVPKSGAIPSCVAGTLAFKDGKALLDPLYAHVPGGTSLAGKNAILDLSTGMISPELAWTPENDIADTLRETLSKTEGLIPPGTPCAFVPGAAQR